MTTAEIPSFPNFLRSIIGSSQAQRRHREVLRGTDSDIETHLYLQIPVAPRISVIILKTLEKYVYNI